MKAYRLLLLLALLLLCGRAQAACTLGIGCTCSVTTTSVVFGSYNPLSSSNADISGSVKVTCAGLLGGNIGYSVALSAGSGGTGYARRLQNGAKYLPYNLYTGNDYGTVWGDGSGTTATRSGNIPMGILGAPASDTMTIYGRIPGGQFTATPGGYSDTMVVTVTYE